MKRRRRRKERKQENERRENIAWILISLKWNELEGFIPSVGGVWMRKLSICCNSFIKNQD